MKVLSVRQPWAWALIFGGKDIDKVMAAQSDLVEVVAELRAVLCVKG